MSLQDDGVVWESIRWPDGSLYEGLTKQGRMHRNGILMHANGDRYEGEFVDGQMQGYGAYVWRDGTVYRGEWVQGVAHGCGVRLWRNAGPQGQGQQAQEQGGLSVQSGKFLGDEYVGPVMACSEAGATEAAVEADVAARLAREFSTAEGHRARMQLVSRARGVQGSRPDGANAATPTSDRPPTPTQVAPATTHAGARQQPRQEAGWRFRWPWERDPPQASLSSPHTASTSTSQERGLSHQGTSGGGGGSVGGVATQNGSVGRASLPAGHPAHDPDVGFKSRGLREDEKQLAGAFVDFLMAKAAREHQQHQQTQPPQQQRP